MTAVLEPVHRFATKVCTKAWEDVDCDERLCMLNLPTLKARRYSLKLCFLYKLLNGLAFMPNSLVDYRRNLPYSTSSHSYPLQVPFACTTSYYKYFFCEAPQLWNKLPIEDLSSTSFTEHVRFFTVNNTYTPLLCFSSFCLVKRSVLACMLPMYPMSCT